MTITEYNDHTLGNYYLGRLALPNELTGNNRNSVFDEIGTGTIKVMIKIISEVPTDIKERLEENELTQALAYRLQKEGMSLKLLKNNRMTPSEKAKKLKEYLSNAVVVFQLEQKNGHLNPAQGAQIKTAADIEDLQKQYEAIPFFNVDDKESLIQTFIKQEPLSQYRSLLINRNFDQLFFKSGYCPTYVLIQEADHVYAFGPLEGVDRSKNLVKQTERYSDYEYWEGDGESEFTLNFSPSAAIIPVGTDDFLLKQYSNLSDFAPPDAFNTTCYFVDEQTSQRIKEKLAAQSEQTTGHKETSVARTTDTRKTKNQDHQFEQDEQSEEVALERKLLETFKQTAEHKGLYYDPADLYNFHTAMKTGNLVILAGMSGTGKSKIVECYAEALGLIRNNQYLKIPVRPFWQDDSDLLGYLDVLNNVYRPGESKFVEFLSRAEQQPGELFIVCFDEMNLARVEHYFSQFLSVLEQDSGERKINLYNDDFKGRLYNSEKYKPTITIHDNVLFVGTVNLDESTYHFSDKVLDRANVIRLKMRNFADIYDERRESLNGDSDTFHSVHLSTEQFLKGTDDYGKGLSRRELGLLWEIHCAMNECNEELGVGLRIVNQINRYLICLPDYGPITREEALDLQIVQRILSKVRGSEEQLRTLVGSTNHVGKGKLIEILDKYQDLSSFTEAVKRLQSIAKEIDVFGYTL